MKKVPVMEKLESTNVHTATSELSTGKSVPQITFQAYVDPRYTAPNYTAVVLYPNEQKIHPYR